MVQGVLVGMGGMEVVGVPRRLVVGVLGILGLRELRGVLGGRSFLEIRGVQPGREDSILKWSTEITGNERIFGRDPSNFVPPHPA